MRTILTTAILAVLPVVASAQRAPSASFEIRPYAGISVPTGDHRDLLNDAPFTGAQVARELRPGFTAVASFGWAPTEDLTRATTNDVDIYQYDIGAEVSRVHQIGEAWQFKPFAGLGVGGRTYAYRDIDVDAQTHFAGYAALGGELQRGRIALRLEGRDYVSGFNGLDGSASTSTRNDLSVAAGIAYHFR